MIKTAQFVLAEPPFACTSWCWAKVANLCLGGPLNCIELIILTISNYILFALYTNNRYVFVLFQRNLVAQTGDPTATGSGGESIYWWVYVFMFCS